MAKLFEKGRTYKDGYGNEWMIVDYIPDHPFPYRAYGPNDLEAYFTAEGDRAGWGHRQNSLKNDEHT